MARDELALYLTLSAEFGGTRFGPFEGLEVRLGADKDRCHIMLPEAFGVAREHCKVIRQGEGLIIAASERTAAVFVWKGDARRPTQIQAPTSVRPGDSFALVSPEGARFSVELGPLPAEMLAARDKQKRRNKATTDGYAKEGWRMLVARVWTLGPFGLIMQFWYLLTSGSLFQPQVLIPLVIAAVGYLGAAGGSCAAFKFKRDEKKAVAALEECNDRASAGGGVATMNATPLDLMTAVVGGNSSLKATLEKETGLSAMVQKKIAGIFDTRADYDWLFQANSGAAGDWIKLRAAIDDSEKFDDLTKLLLPYTSTMPKRTAEKWNVQLDTLGARSCLRGPARLTYRQAVSLGFEAVQLDGYHGDETAGFVADDPGRLSLLAATAAAAGAPPLPDPPPAVEEAPLASGREFCVFASGDDDRESLSKVLQRLERHFGTTANYVPDPSVNQAGVGRIVKFYAADVPGNNYEGGSPSLDFSSNYLSPLNEQAAKDKIVERTAEVLARAVALPCIAALDHPDVTETTFGRRIQAERCLLLDYKLRHPGT